MSKQNLTAWFLGNGFVGIPKNLMALIEPLGLSFDDIGKILYLLYYEDKKIKKTDRLASEAIKSLEKKGMINWFKDEGKVDFSPMFNLIAEKMGNTPEEIEIDTEKKESGISYSQFIKKLEKKLARFLTVKEKIELQKASQRYNWTYELLYEMFLFYQSNYRRQYAFSFFAQMAYGAKVENKQSFVEFVENLNYTTYKVTEIKRRLGQKNFPTEVEKECYLKWANEWKFTHEMILLAVEQTIHATDPTFSYIDKVLENWNKEGLKTSEDLKAFLQKRQENKKKKNKTIEKNPVKYLRDLSYLEE